MKPFILSAILSWLFVGNLQAQELKKIQLFMVSGKLAEAKAEVDKSINDPKFSGKPETYYWRSRIYAAIFTNEALRAKTPNAKEIAEEAFAKYQQLDPQYNVIKELGADGPQGYFDLYQGSFKDGVRTFNAKKWDSAAYYFTASVKTYDIIYQNKWIQTKTPFDTTSLLYLGYAYQNQQKAAEAVEQYTRLADNRVADESYMDMYRYILGFFTTSKNESQFRKYLEVSKQMYPKENWDDYEMDYLEKNLTLTEKASLYDKESTAGTLNEYKYLQYGDWFANSKNKDKDMDSATHALYSLKASDAFQKAYALNNKNAIAAFNAGLLFYNNFNDYSDKYSENIRTLQQINANKPAPDKDPKKRAQQEAKFKEQTDAVKKLNTELDKPINENLETSISWMEKAVDALKGRSDLGRSEKMVFDRSLDFLANMYEYKRDRMRGKDMKLYDLYDAKYKEYESMHKKN
ncbi:MAG: hypothetical protein ACKO1T_02260 [Sediminibacterium sp.]